jgi:hypothetical protein
MLPDLDDDDPDTEPLRRKNMRRRARILLFLLVLPVVAFAQSPGRSFEWTCSLDNIGATLTECQRAPEPGMRLYLTDVVINSTTATAGQFLLRTGTGSNCGTGTASLLPSSASVVRLGYPGNATAGGPAVLAFETPLAAPSATALCILCVATNTCTVQMAGYLAP